MPDTNQLHSDIAGLRSDVQATNKNVERIASLVEKTTDDHEHRLRNLELAQAKSVSREEFDEMRKFHYKVLGVLTVIAALGLPSTIYILSHLGAK